MMKPHRRFTIRVVCFALAAVAVLCGFLIRQRRVSDSYRMVIESGYASAFAELADSVAQLDAVLEKQLHANSASYSGMLASQAYKLSALAKDSLCELPLDGEFTGGIYRFLSQAGNFSLSLAQKQNGKPMNAEDFEALCRLREYSAALTDKLNDAGALLLESGGFEDAGVLSEHDDYGKSLLYDTAQDIEQTVSAYPELIYDGPFSDHIEKAEPLLIKDARAVTENSARIVAAKALGCSPEQLSATAAEGGKTEAYRFVSSDNNGTAAVTKQGGLLLYMSRAAADDGGAKMSAKAASKIAEKFVEDTFGGDFVTSYYMTSENVCTVNLAYAQDDVICYGDLIKAGVALDSGGVVFVEARGYIMNHHRRGRLVPKYTAAQCKKVLSDYLAVRRVKLAVILSEGQNEYLCYEFVCGGVNDEAILVYIDADTRTERNILILTKTPGAVLTR